jgi:hypothetical protein
MFDKFLSKLRFAIKMKRQEFREFIEKRRVSKAIRNIDSPNVSEMGKAKKLIEIDIFNIKNIPDEIQNDSEFQSHFLEQFSKYLTKIDSAAEGRKVPEQNDLRQLYFYKYYREDIDKITNLIKSESLKLLIKLQG